MTASCARLISQGCLACSEPKLAEPGLRTAVARVVTAKASQVDLLGRNTELCGYVSTLAFRGQSRGMIDPKS